MRRLLGRYTPRGAVFLVAGVSVTVAALALGQRDLVRIGVLLLALPVVSLLLSFRGRIDLRAQREIRPARVAAGETAEVDLEVRSMRPLPAAALLVEEDLPAAIGDRARIVLDRAWSRGSRAHLRYPVRAEQRGRYRLGPVSALFRDPFGLVTVRRTSSETGTLLVTPQVEPLPMVRLAGEWSGSGESRPRAVASAGEEDATVRPYRQGDDMRRVHWRASARFDDLVVRREEQPWQSRTTVLLDTRASGHAGRGPTSSFEWSVVATASIGSHLVRRGYAVRLVTDDGGASAPTWHLPTSEAATLPSPLLDRLAVVTPHPDASIQRWPDLMSSAEEASGLLVAVLGRLTPAEAGVVAALRHGSAAAFAVLQDVASWTSGSARADQLALARSRQILERAGWTVAVARRGDTVSTVWQGFGPARSGVPSGAAAAAGAR